MWPGIQNGILLIGSFNDLLVGQAGNVLGAILSTRSGPGGPIHGYRMTDMNTFVQDDWKVNSHLTLNLGTRWEYDGTLSDKYANLTNLWLSRLQSVTTLPTGPTTSAAGFTGYVVPHNFTEHYGQPPDGVLVNSNNTGLSGHPPLSNFAPRIGVAWQPGNLGKLVIRAGAGMFYDRVSTIAMSSAYGNNPPYAANVTYGFPNSQTLADPFPHTSLALQPRWANLATGQTSLLNVPFVNEVQHTPLVRQYNFNVQYQFIPRWTLEAGYVGSSGINLEDFSHNYNTAQLASAASPIHGVTTNTLANINLRVPYLGFAPTGLLGTGYDLISLQQLADHAAQFSHGFTMQAAYTWSKSLTNSENSANYNNASDPPSSMAPLFQPAAPVHRELTYDLPSASSGALGKRPAVGASRESRRFRTARRSPSSTPTRARSTAHRQAIPTQASPAPKCARGKPTRISQRLETSNSGWAGAAAGRAISTPPHSAPRPSSETVQDSGIPESVSWGRAVRLGFPVLNTRPRRTSPTIPAEVLQHRIRNLTTG